MLFLTGNIALANPYCVAEKNEQHMQAIAAKFPFATSLHNRSCEDHVSIGGCFQSANCQQHFIYFNGVIFNYKDLAAWLQLPAHDKQHEAELVLQLLLKKGTGGVEKINGQFLIIYYNLQAQKVYLINDHFGIAQLYYY